MQAQAECATAVWRQPDQGIWEARGKPQHYVSSKLMCWVAMDRAAKLAAIRGDAELEAKWRATAEEIQADILAHGLDQGRRAAPALRHRRARRLDAAGGDLRLPARPRRAPARLVLAIADDLTENGFVLRYRTDETDDGLSGKEGTFLICSFWLVSALSIVGEAQRARDLMERLLRVASPLGLYAEEFDADTGRHLGNFPQAFSHLALIEAAARIVLAERCTAPASSVAADRARHDHYDVIIIGSGAGGGTLARAPAPVGQARPAARARRLAAARAPERPAAEVFVDNRYVSPDTWPTPTARPFQPEVHYYVGGATKLLRRGAVPAAR